MLRTFLFIIASLTFFFHPMGTKGQTASFEVKTVVIDPGHGGRDPGASSGKVLEKDIVLDVAIMTGKIIKEKYPDVEVIYTRDKDVFVALADRAELANKAKADIFISIHCNAFHSSGISGAETYILGNHRSEENLRVAQKENAVILLEDDHNTRYEGFDPNSAESYIMFELIQNEFLEQSRQFADHLQRSFVSSAMRRDRGVRQAGFLVLRRTTMPSVLVELGFISNKADMSFLVSNEGKNKMARSIADAFSTYKTRVDSRTGSVVTIEHPAQPAETKTERENKQAITSITSVVENGQWYTVQILASRTRLSEEHHELKKALPVYYHYDNEWFRYYTKPIQNIDEAYNAQDLAKKNFNGAFVVRFINGKKDRVIRY